MTGMKILLAIMAGLEITDGVFTGFAAGNGMVGEGNALMRALVMSGDFLWLKIAGALLCAAALGLLYRRFPGTARGVTSTIIVMYTVIMVWNISIFFGV